MIKKVLRRPGEFLTTKVLYLVYLFLSVIFLFFILEFVLSRVDFFPKVVVRPMFYTDLIGDLEPNIKVIDTTYENWCFKTTTNFQGLRSLRDIQIKKPILTPKELDSNRRIFYPRK